MRSWDSMTGRECVRFDVSQVEAETGTLLIANGSQVCVPKSEAGQGFAMACARAAVDGRREWHRPA